MRFVLPGEPRFRMRGKQSHPLGSVPLGASLGGLLLVALVIGSMGALSRAFGSTSWTEQA